MSIQLTVPPKRELKPRITVIGVGGAGGNAVNNMITAGLEGVDFVVANTDAQALSGSKAERRIQIGAQLTEGLGAGSDPDTGRAAAEEALAEIVDQIQGSHMAFVTAGMGGGTGTGAASVIARACREQGILTIGVVTKPFDFEGPRRMKSAEYGIAELAKEVDTLIIIPNQNLFRVANEKTGFVEAFAIADEVLHSGVASVTDLMTKPGLINLDFADVKMVMNEMGKAMMGTGEADGDSRAIDAAEAAIANPLLEDDSMQGASGVLINITGGQDMTLYEVDEAANRIKREVDTNANIIIGAIYDEGLNGSMRVSVVATGIDADEDQVAANGPRLVQLRNPDQPVTLPTAETAGESDMLDRTGMMDEADGQEFDEAMEQPREGDSLQAMPDFLTEEPLKPETRPMPKRSRGFLDRVLRGRRNDTGEPEAQLQTSASTSTSTQEPMVEDTPATDLQTEPQADSVAPDLTGPDLIPDESFAIPPVNRREVAQSNLPELGVQPRIGEQPPVMQEQPAVQISDQAVAEQAVRPKVSDMVAEQPIEAQAETKAIPKPAAKPVAKKAAKPAAKIAKKAPVVAEAAAPVKTAAVEAQPAVTASAESMVQTSMQSTMISSSYEDAQLDIPAFLRRQD